MGNICISPASVHVEDQGKPEMKGMVLPVMTDKVKVTNQGPEPKLKHMKRNLVL